MAVIIGKEWDASHVKRTLEDPRRRRMVLANPELTDTLMQQATLISGLTCTEVEDDLAAFIDAESRSGEASSAYRRLQEHLYRCPQCYEEYCLAIAIAEAQRTGELPAWPGASPRHQRRPL